MPHRLPSVGALRREAGSVAGGGPPATLIVLPGAIGAALVAMAILRGQQRRASA
jgi:hypothetical protein